MLEPLDLLHLRRERVIGCYLVESTEGPALFDCGPASCVPEMKNRLAERSLELRDLRHLLLSHIHLDHAGAAGTLVREHPELQVHVSEIGAPHLVDPERLERRTAWVGEGMSRDEFIQAAAKDLGPDRDAYEHAMPLWQSYAGLERYWQKKLENAPGT